MSSLTQAGNCPRCGAPMWLPSVWHGVTPPPITRSCSCFPQPQVYTGTNTVASNQDSEHDK